jgi:hypothetical protein
MRSLTKGGGHERQSGLRSGGNFGKHGGGAGKTGVDMGSRNHKPDGPGPVGHSHPKTGSQRSHWHSASGTHGGAHGFPDRRK